MFNLIGNKWALVLAAFIMTVMMNQGAQADSYSGQRKAVELLFKSNEEKSAKDAVWTTDNIFKVGVIDNGSDRSGYASYICSVLDDYGFSSRSVWVQVIDIVKLKDNKECVTLGDARCN